MYIQLQCTHKSECIVFNVKLILYSALRSICIRGSQRHLWEERFFSFSGYSPLLKRNVTPPPSHSFSLTLSLFLSHSVFSQWFFSYSFDSPPAPLSAKYIFYWYSWWPPFEHLNLSCRAWLVLFFFSGPKRNWPTGPSAYCRRLTKSLREEYDSTHWRNVNFYELRKEHFDIFLCGHSFFFSSFFCNLFPYAYYICFSLFLLEFAVANFFHSFIIFYVMENLYFSQIIIKILSFKLITNDIFGKMLYLTIIIHSL